MKRKLLTTILLSALILTGCWDQKELAEITVVTGMAVDKGEDDKYYLTVEGINATELNNRTASGFAPSIVYGVEGNSLSELTQKMNVAVSKKLIFSHMRTLIIGEELAGEGVIDFIDYLERNREIRDDFNILLAKDVKASDILKVTYQFQKSPSLKLHTQLNTMMENWGGDPGVRMNDVISAWTSPGRQPVMSAVTIKGSPSKGLSSENMKKVTPDALVILDSLAVFNGDQLAGFISLEDARNYLWTQDKVKKTSLTVPCGENLFIDLRIYNTRTRLKGSLQNGRPHFSVDIRAEGLLEGIQCHEPLEEVETYVKLENKTEKHIEKIVLNTIRNVQEDYGADIFGFGEVLKRQDYKNFKKVKDEWDETFKEADVKVNAIVKIRRSGIRTKSFLMEEK